MPPQDPNQPPLGQPEGAGWGAPQQPEGWTAPPPAVQPEQPEQPEQPQYGQSPYGQPPQYGQAPYGQPPQGQAGQWGQVPPGGYPPVNPYGQQPFAPKKNKGKKIGIAVAIIVVIFGGLVAIGMASDNATNKPGRDAARSWMDQIQAARFDDAAAAMCKDNPLSQLDDADKQAAGLDDGDLLKGGLEKAFGSSDITGATYGNFVKLKSSPAIDTKVDKTLRGTITVDGKKTDVAYSLENDTSGGFKYCVYDVSPLILFE